MDPMPTDYYDVFEGPLTGEHGCVPPPFGIGTGRDGFARTTGVETVPASARDARRGGSKRGRTTRDEV
jgi:hypothetical protein